MAIHCHGRGTALVRGESLTSLFFRSDIQWHFFWWLTIKNCYKNAQNNGWLHCLSGNPIVCANYTHMCVHCRTLLLLRHLITAIWWPPLNAAGWTLDSSCSWAFELHAPLNGHFHTALLLLKCMAYRMMPTIWSHLFRCFIVIYHLAFKTPEVPTSHFQPSLRQGTFSGTLHPHSCSHQSDCPLSQCWVSIPPPDQNHDVDNKTRGSQYAC